MLDNVPLKLFLTLFFIYAFFIHFGGWNEQSRLLPAISIVDKGKLEIDDYANLTGDRVYLNEHYYSDKAPGTSFLLIPIYSFSKFLTNDSYNPEGKDKILIPQSQFNTTTYMDASPGPAFKLASLLGTVLLSSLPGAFVPVIIYFILLSLTKDRKVSLLIALIFGLGTMIFSYSTVLMGNILPLLLILLSFYISAIKKNVSNKVYFVSGLLLGLSILFDYLSLIFSFLLFIFLIRKGGKKILYLISGGAITVIPLLFYHFIIFNNPLTLPQFYIDPQIFPCVHYLATCAQEYYQTAGSSFPLGQYLLSSFYLLFSPYRGLFIYIPFLLFSFLGLKYLYLKNKPLTIFIAVLFVLYVLGNVFAPLPWAGNSFGPRYILVAVPFLSISTAYFMKHSKHFYLKLILGSFALISIFIAFLGVSEPWEGVEIHYGENEFVFGRDAKIFKFKDRNIANLNPLYDHYLSGFLENGARSRIFEQSILGKIPDIRDFQPTPVEEMKLLTMVPFGILTLKVPFLILSVLASTTTLIWFKELKQHKKLFFLIIVIITIAFLSRLSFSGIVYGKEFYPQSINESIKWFGVESKMTVYSNENGNKILNISLDAYRFDKSRSLDLLVNGKMVGTFHDDSIVEKVYFKRGENAVTLISREGCDYPIKISNSTDSRCISFGIKNFDIIDEKDLPKGALIFGSGWYDWEIEKTTGDGIKFASSNAYILFVPADNVETFVNISMLPYKIRTVEFHLNDEQIGAYTQPYNILEKMQFNEGINQIKLFSKNGCEILALVENSTGYRCLSFGIYNISVIKTYNLPSNEIIFGSGWYDWEIEKTTGDPMKLSSNESYIYIYSNRTKEAVLNLTLSPYNLAKVSIYSNNEYIGIYDKPQTILQKTNLNQGLNQIKFIADGCNIPATKENSTDYRCLSFSVKNIFVN